MDPRGAARRRGRPAGRPGGAATDERVAAARRIALDRGFADDARLAEREAIAVGAQELATLAALWPATAAGSAASPPRSPPLRRAPAAPATPACPSAPPPCSARSTSTTTTTSRPCSARGLTPRWRSASEVFAYEALNLVDGKRSVGDIRDLLSGRYAPCPAAEVAE